MLYKGGGENPPTDSDSEYTEDEADSESDDNEDIYCPENDSDSYGSDSETELDASLHENDTEIHKQIKFIVFQNQLPLLLTKYLACFSKEVAVYHIVKRSRLTAYVKCLFCKTVREWKSQPEIRNYAAGDILLSGATLFNGLLRNEFLRALMSIKIACISPRTFFRHQGIFLHGAVRNVWAKRQNDLFDKIRVYVRAPCRWRWKK